jgi:hypothetical protein
MTTLTTPDHPAPMYVSTPTYAIPAKLARDTVYMPSHLAARMLRADHATSPQRAAGGAGDLHGHAPEPPARYGAPVVLPLRSLRSGGRP